MTMVDGLERPPRPLTCTLAKMRWNGIAGPRLIVRGTIWLHRPGYLKGTAVMKTIAVLFAVASLALASTSADAKGCLKGAAVGGVAGHYAGHHGVLGAVAGCIYGRRHAKQQELQRQQQQQGKGADVGQTGM
jgi:hypothetical protein